MLKRLLVGHRRQPFLHYRLQPCHHRAYNRNLACRRQLVKKRRHWPKSSWLQDFGNYWPSYTRTAAASPLQYFWQQYHVVPDVARPPVVAVVVPRVVDSADVDDVTVATADNRMSLSRPATTPHPPSLPKHRDGAPTWLHYTTFPRAWFRLGNRQRRGDFP